MRAKTKSAVVLIVTLLIGVAIGALGWSTLHSKRMEKLRDARNERQSFYSMVESKVAPLQEGQQPDLERVVEEYRRQFGQLYRDAVRDRSALMDSMVVELDSILTDEQSQRLRDWVHDSRERDRNRREKEKERDRGDGTDREAKDAATGDSSANQ